MKDLMIDLETLGIAPGSIITQIGGVLFDRHEVMAFGEEFQWWVDVDDSLGYRLEVSGSTLQWWTEQDPVALKRTIKSKSNGALGLHQALGNLRHFVRSHGVERVWSHGPAFDVALINAAAHRAGFPEIWSHRSPRDTRTLFDLVGGAPESLFRGVTHYALDDAKASASQVQLAFLALRNGLADAASTGPGALVQPGSAQTLSEAVGFGYTVPD